jgi:aspartate carbamoyltransferase catalytic subunit
MNFAVSSSSVNKGESLRDTIETVAAMGVDAFVIRHGSSGAAQQITQWTNASVVNAGDGWHQHPTQALLDCYTIPHPPQPARLALRRIAHRDRRRHQAQPGRAQRHPGVLTASAPW